jgi:hypothetical protein
MELIALFLAVHAATALAYKVIGIRNKAVLLMFVITWLASGAKRFSEIRLGTHACLHATARTGKDLLVILAGAGPWVALGFLQRLRPTWPVWGISAELPMWLTAIGVVLGVIAVVQQRAPTSSEDSSASRGLMPQLTGQTQILALAILLMSGSLVVGLIVGIWLAVSRCGPERFDTECDKESCHSAIG